MKLGSLFSGAGGLDMAVEQVFGGQTVWHCEVDPVASKVLAHRWPGVPNLSDITAVDWTQVEPVDVLCGGWPCQPFSIAGKRKGADDERALWPYVARAVRMVRPRVVVLENVSAVLGPEFQRVANDLAALGYDLRWTCLRASDVGAPHRRERLFVLAYAAEQFGEAVPQGDDAEALDVTGFGTGDRDSAGDSAARIRLMGRSARCICGHEAEEHSGLPGWSTACTACLCNGFTPDSSSDGRHEGRPEPARLIRGSDAAVSGDGPLLPTPAVNDIGEGKTVEWWDEWTAKSKAKHGNGNGHGNSLAIEALRVGGDRPVDLLPTPRGADGNGGGNYNSPGHQDTLPGTVRLLPTPTSSDTSKHSGQPPEKRVGHTLRLTDVTEHLPAYSLLQTPSTADGDGGHLNRSGARKDEQLLPGQARQMDGQQWGKYEPAIRRWEHLTCPAPAPTEPNKNGNPRLNPEFSSWLMGWPAGWVTNPAIGISRNDQLRIIGNGVVPQQATAALRYLLRMPVEP